MTELKTRLELYGESKVKRYELRIKEDIDYNKIEDDRFFIDIDRKKLETNSIYFKFLKLQIYRIFGETSKIEASYNVEARKYRIVITRGKQDETK